MAEEESYRVEEDWLIQVTGGCTCNGGGFEVSGAHEDYCGLEPVARIDQLLQAMKFYVEHHRPDPPTKACSRVDAHGSHQWDDDHGLMSSTYACPGIRVHPNTQIGRR